MRITNLFSSTARDDRKIDRSRRLAEEVEAIKEKRKKQHAWNERMDKIKDVYLGDRLQEAITSHLRNIKNAAEHKLPPPLRLTILELAYSIDPSEESLKKIVEWLNKFCREKNWRLLDQEAKTYIIQEVFGGEGEIDNELARCKLIWNSSIKQSIHFRDYIEKLTELSISIKKKPSTAEEAEVRPIPYDELPDEAATLIDDLDATDDVMPANNGTAKTDNVAAADNDTPAATGDTVTFEALTGSPKVTTPFILEKIFRLGIPEDIVDNYGEVVEILPKEGDQDWFSDVGSLGNYFDSSKYPDTDIRNIYSHVASFQSMDNNWKRLMIALANVSERERDNKLSKYNRDLAPQQVLDMLVRDIADEADWILDNPSLEIIAHFLIDVLCILERIAENSN